MPSQLPHSECILYCLFWVYVGLFWVYLGLFWVCTGTLIQSAFCIVYFDAPFLQCVAVCCSVLQCVAVCCSMLSFRVHSVLSKCVAVWYCSVLLQPVVVCCCIVVLRCVVPGCLIQSAFCIVYFDAPFLQCVAACCSVLQCVAVCCSVLSFRVHSVLSILILCWCILLIYWGIPQSQLVTDIKTL